MLLTEGTQVAVCGRKEDTVGQAVEELARDRAVKSKAKLPMLGTMIRLPNCSGSSRLAAAGWMLRSTMPALECSVPFRNFPFMNGNSRWKQICTACSVAHVKFYSDSKREEEVTSSI